MNKAQEARNLIYGNIDAIMRNAQALQAEKTVNLDVLLNANFMQTHTDLGSVEQMFALAGETEISEESLERIDDGRWGEIVVSHSEFACWQDMFTTASQSYVRSRLLDGIRND